MTLRDRDAMPGATMRIGELSRQSGVSTPTIKFYLREGLLPRGRRTARNQAEYSEGHVRRLRLIQALTEVGLLPIASVRAVLHAIDDPRVPLHEVLSVAHHALAPPSDPGEKQADFANALADVDTFLRELGWTVDPNSPARRELAKALRTLRHLGRDADPRLFEPYARAADRIAARELATIDLDAPREQVVDDIVVGTVVFEAALVALRRLAQEHHAAVRLSRGRGPRGKKATARPESQR
jgi:DNA-binding transcriptional MerR regulator